MKYFLLVFALMSQPVQMAPPDYELGPQDKLAVTVFGEDELTRSVTVDADGGFDFPYIGRVKAAGLTVRGLQAELQQRLGPPRGPLVSPQVTVEIESYRTQYVHVQGAVSNPGMVAMTGAMSLMEAISKAGSPTQDAGPYVLIHRRQPGTTGDQPVVKPGASTQPPQRVALADVQSGKAQFVFLRPGDTVQVPRAEKFQVNGHVARPGNYVLDDEPMTVQRAIGLAGGPTETGAMNRVSIFRTVNGRLVELKRVKMTDLVQAEDIINVPRKRV